MKNDLTGSKFGRFTLLHIDSESKRVKWICRCECGVEKSIYERLLISGESKSCGCLRIDTMRAIATKHGRSVGKKNDATYSVWLGMRSRCMAKTGPKHSKYASKGITVCQRWMDSFDAFVKDMGERPDGMTIDRYPDKRGNYEPGNCRWATQKEQQNNRTNNLPVDIPTLSERFGVKRGTLYYRYHHNLPLIPGLVEHEERQAITQQ